jgi:hypothetical protein
MTSAAISRILGRPIVPQPKLDEFAYERFGQHYQLSLEGEYFQSNKIRRYVGRSTFSTFESMYLNNFSDIYHLEIDFFNDRATEIHALYDNGEMKWQLSEFVDTLAKAWLIPRQHWKVKEYATLNCGSVEVFVSDTKNDSIGLMLSLDTMTTAKQFDAACLRVWLKEERQREARKKAFKP